MSETIRGQVEGLRLFDGGWGVVTVLYGSARERLDVTGHPLGVEIGDTIEAEGNWSQHPRFGRQFKARTVRVIAPADAGGVIEWMISKLPQIGRKLATAIVERWGVEGTWRVLEQTSDAPGQLVELAGITPARAQAIYAAYQAHRAERDQLVELKGFGLTDGQVARVLDTWGDRTIEELRRDPYQLAELVDGFGFKRADAIALRMGLPTTHPSRVRAALLHVLDEAASAGNVYLPAGALVRCAVKLLGVEERIVRREANALLDEDRLVMTDRRAYRPKLARAEESLADGLARLVRRSEAA